jgi:ornithine cyclodeaminase
MPEALLLSRADLERTLDFPSVIAVLEEAFHAERRGLWDTPKRIAARTRAGVLLAMPCGGGAPSSLGAKLVTTFAGNTVLGLPSVSGLYALFDPDTGALRAVMDGGYLTLVRTAAVSALATRLLARDDARSLGVLGAGAQAAFHIRLIATVRPIEKVMVWARRRDRAEALVASLKSREDLRQVSSWTVAAEASQAARHDIVVTATAAPEPVLLGPWLSEGASVIPIGAHTRTTREIDTEAVVRASVLAVESSDTLLDAGDFQMAEDEAGGVVRRVVTLGALLDPSFPKPRDSRAIAIFKSCGVAFEDLAVASLAFHRAREAKIGTRFAFV